MEYELILLGLTVIFAGFMAWGIGANDVANAMGTSVGSSALTLKQAIVIAAIFEFLGAVLAGGEVTATIRKGIVGSGAFSNHPQTLLYGMLAAMLAAGTWLAAATNRGWPVSTTHSIIGAIIGFTVVSLGVDAVAWQKVGVITTSWVLSPLCAGFVGFVLARSINRLILDHRHPYRNARRYTPVYVGLAVFVIALLTLSKGLKHIAWAADISTAGCYAIAVGLGLVIGLASIYLIRHVHLPADATTEIERDIVEHIFSILMVVTACSMAFAHGSNDVANAIGPAAAIISVLETGTVDQSAPLPVWMLMLGGGGIVLGLVTYGQRVIATVGSRITPLTPTRGFAAGISASSTIVFASASGMPVSTTHALVGAVLGVGLAQNVPSIDPKVVIKIVASWLITIPAGALLSILFFYVLQFSLEGVATGSRLTH